MTGTARFMARRDLAPPGQRAARASRFARHTSRRVATKCAGACGPSGLVYCIHRDYTMMRHQTKTMRVAARRKRRRPLCLPHFLWARLSLLVIPLSDASTNTITDAHCKGASSGVGRALALRLAGAPGAAESSKFGLHLCGRNAGSQNLSGPETDVH